MKSTTITMKELKRGNKRMCISALRALGRCYKCVIYDAGTCESKIRNRPYDTLKRELDSENERHQQEVKSIKNKMEEL